MRYVAITPTTSGWWDADGEKFLARTIHEEDRKPVDTGLMNASGVNLYRAEDKQPIGFVRIR